jgi:hypothetical protein
VDEERPVSRLAWSAFAGAALISVAGMALLVFVPSEVLERKDNSFALSATFAAIPLVFGLVGAVVASRLPGNPIGWLFLGIALLNGIYELSYGWASYAVSVDPLPAARWAAWVADWTSPLTPPLIVASLLLFPDGRLPGPRWRWALWATAPVSVLVLMQFALAPGPIDEFPPLANPAGVASARWLADVNLEPLYTPLFIAGAAALVVRFRRSHGVEHQQVKWFAYAASLVAAYLIFGSVVTGLFGGKDSVAAGFAFAASFAAVPVAAGVAILRYRLYDIDLVIRRTLVYAALTATLAAAYLGSVLLAGLAVGESGVAVAVSTLAVAALARPALTRIQALVDRRFYRRRYDAALTLQAFSTRLRDEVDLDALGADLGGVVREALQPAHVSLWLRSAR